MTLDALQMLLLIQLACSVLVDPPQHSPTCLTQVGVGGLESLKDAEHARDGVALLALPMIDLEGINMMENYWATSKLKSLPYA